MITFPEKSQAELRPYKILHLEDVMADAMLAARELKKHGIQFDHYVVETESEYLAALDSYLPDIILCDHSLRGYNSLAAIKALKSKQLYIPFILITATIDEEFAMMIVNEGAEDYILKDRLKRLPKAIVNAIETYRTKEAEKHAIQSIKESEAKYRSFFENSMDGMLITAVSGQILSVNPAACKIFRMNSAEMFETGLLGLIAASDKRFAQMVKQRQVDGVAKAELTFVRKNGDTFEGEVSSAIFKDAFGNEVASMIIRDVSERHAIETEKQKITEDLIQHNKELEQFNFIVSHNLRAPVTNIIGACELFKEITITNDDREILIEGIRISVERLDNVIKDLNTILNVKKNDRKIREEVSLSEVLNDVKFSLKDTIDATCATINTDFRHPFLFTVRSYIQSIFFNIISNSLKYRRPDVQLVILISSKSENNHVTLQFTDNGSGIDMSKKSGEVFKLYKRFHLEIEGKGMGLFMIKTQVESLGGKISLNSKVGEGTTIKITL